ncbi:threonine dehydrogenase-like Zn-dependent dehydrogenase [Streptosporangium becharense]|uniref:Threonine dehydrogenase-like Zn-dependent dehydrogenase n=1 Tax=Streptosporangium becharense TaxID=1816182 RepID=A0A7W9IP44_9ACTN|nr:threonine dehydrogenase-like Zn-dependent dehydrogenase [Streptosporangium becharense]MBB5823703.1 threonine dehydrogenase-like Zn-dependent dehydrogenase [Streptosporangium becharense]
MPDADLIPSLLTASDVLGTGWFAAVAAEAGPSKTVAVVGDGAGVCAGLGGEQVGRAGRCRLPGGPGSKAGL